MAIRDWDEFSYNFAKRRRKKSRGKSYDLRHCLAAPDNIGESRITNVTLRLASPTVPLSMQRQPQHVVACRRSCVYTRREATSSCCILCVSRFVYVLPACLRPIEKFAATRVRPRALVCRNSRIDVTNSGRPTSCFARLQMKTKVYAVLFSFYPSLSLFTNKN